MSTNEQILEASPARFAAELMKDSLMDVPGAIRTVEGAEVGINRALVRGNPAGLRIIIPPTGNPAGKRIAVYFTGKEQPVLSFDVPADYDGNAFIQYITAKQIPEGFSELFYTLADEASKHLKVLVKTVVPVGNDPQPNIPGHSLLLPPEITTTVLDGQQDETVRILPWPGMHLDDQVMLQFSDLRLLSQVEKVGEPVFFTLRKEDIARHGDGQSLMHYWISDNVENPAPAHSLGTSVTIKTSTERLPPPTVDIDQQHAVYLGKLGSQPLTVTLDTASGRFTKGDKVELHWRGELVTQTLELVTQELTVGAAPKLTFNIPNAIVQRLAGGWAHVYFNWLKAGNEAQLSSFIDIFIVGNTRRID